MKILRNFLIAALLLAIGVNSGIGQISPNHLKAQFESGKLSYIQYLEYSALNLYEPNRVPQEYRIAESAVPQRSGTFLVQQIKEHWNELNSEAQKILAKHLQRRNDLPYSYVTRDGQFRIHYTTTGSDSVDATDANKNGIPDYVEIAGENFQYIRHLLVDSLGYKPPAVDSSGNGKQFDVYLVNLGIYYGITYLEKIVPGSDNRYSCYMEIENDFRDFPTPPIESLEVTSAHEYFHVVQVNYAYRDSDVFYMEMSSVWMEDFAHTEVNDYLNYLPSFFNHINYPFSYTNNGYEYASALWNHMIVRKYGPDIIRKIWETIPQEAALQAIRDVLQNYGTSFEKELASFGLWNYFTGTHSDTVNFYPEGNLYPEVRFNQQETLLDHHIFVEASMSKLSSAFYRVLDLPNNYSVAVIVSNFEIPTKTSYGNFDPSDKAALSFDLYVLPEDTLAQRDFLVANQLIKISDFHAIRLNIRQKDNWVAQSVVFDAEGNYKVTQFFPGFSAEENQNFIQNIFPNPFVIGVNGPVVISAYLHDEDMGELYIYSSDGRRMKSFPFDASNFYFTTFEWDGVTENGSSAGSGVYVAVLRVGDKTNIKKFAIIRK
ncbi:MAG: hypothetical protein GXO74_04585 [Calditrichaeota bacterium]|nr:hypothetical protein [Calditrichota bacterium]